MAVAPKEGLYAVMTIANLGITLLTGISLSGEQTKSPFYQMGSLNMERYMQGHVVWDIGWTRALTTVANLGSFNVGTLTYLGTVFPRGGTNPLVAGTIVPNSITVTNMEACNESAVSEEFSGKFYNLTFTN